MDPRRPARKALLIPVLMAAATTLIVCAAAVLALAQLIPWDSLLGRHEARVVECVVYAHEVPSPAEVGFAHVTLDVTNSSSRDQIYAVGVAVKSGAGEVVGTAEHRIIVPAGQFRQEIWRVPLTKPGGRECEITKVREDNHAGAGQRGAHNRTHVRTHV